MKPRGGFSWFGWFGWWLAGGFICLAWIQAMRGGGTMLNPEGEVLEIGSNPWPYALIFLGWFLLGAGAIAWEGKYVSRQVPDAKQPPHQDSTEDTET